MNTTKDPRVRIRRETPSVALLAAGLASALGAAACAPDLLRPQRPEGAAEVRVPMRFENGLPLVEGRLPGEGGGHRAWFLIDTGAGSFTLLDEQLTTALRLKHDLVTDPLLPSVSFSTQLEFLEVDGIGRRDLTAYVTDAIAARPDLSGLGVPVHGVLGTGYFRGHCLWFDWGRGEFTATRPRVRKTRHVAIPLRFGIGGDLHAALRVNGHGAEALIDTASPRTLVAQEFAERAGLAWDRAAPAVPRDTSIGPAAARDAVVERLALGTEELSKVAVLVVERRLPNADLVLGTDVLSRYGVTLDLGDRPYLVLDPLEGGAAPEPRSGHPPAR